MKAFYTRIELGNDAMRTPFQIAIALAGIAAMLNAGRTDGVVVDKNGNSVGTWAIE